jgi:hypothetical protein
MILHPYGLEAQYCPLTVAKEDKRDQASFRARLGVSEFDSLIH